MAPAPAPGMRKSFSAKGESRFVTAKKAGERTISERTTSRGSAVGTMALSHSMRPLRTLCPKRAGDERKTAAKRTSSKKAAADVIFFIRGIRYPYAPKEEIMRKTLGLALGSGGGARHRAHRVFAGARRSGHPSRLCDGLFDGRHRGGVLLRGAPARNAEGSRALFEAFQDRDAQHQSHPRQRASSLQQGASAP